MGNIKLFLAIVIVKLMEFPTTFANNFILYLQRERKDRKSTNAVLWFDLQNMVSCPKGEISIFFYKSKFNVHNLTAHFFNHSSVLCSIARSLMDRNENDTTSTDSNPESGFH